MPEHLDQPAAPAAKDEQMAIVRIAFECLLHEQGETIEPLAHVGVAARQPYLHAARHRDHRRRPAFARIVIIARTSERSVAPVIRTREPFANSTSIVPEAGIPFGAGAAAIRTAAKFAAGCAPPCAKLPSPSIQLAWVYPSLASHRGHASARLQRRRYQPLLLLSRPATATLHRGDDFNRGLAHVTIPMNSHMTHTLTRSTRRPLSEGYNSTARKTSGSSCVRIGYQTGFSNPSTISSTIAATLGTHSSTNPGRLCPSRDATGQQSVTQSEDWYNASKRARTQWIGSRSRGSLFIGSRSRGSLFIFRSSPAVAPPGPSLPCRPRPRLARPTSCLISCSLRRRPTKSGASPSESPRAAITLWSNRKKL